LVSARSLKITRQYFSCRRCVNSRCSAPVTIPGSISLGACGRVRNTSVEGSRPRVSTCICGHVRSSRSLRN
jgi:hypothetical protein